MRRDSSFDDGQTELAASARSLSRRVYELASVPDRGERHVTDAFRKLLTRAGQLLQQASEAVTRPDLSRDIQEICAAEPKDVAGMMVASSEPPSAESTMPDKLLQQEASGILLTGSTRVVPVPELLEFLGNMKKTGVMFVRSSHEVFALQLDEGFLVHASSSASPKGNRLGDLLVSLGFVSEEKLNAFVAGHSRWRGKLGVALEREGLVTCEQLTTALEHQVRHLFDRLFALENATFSFAERVASTRENRVRLGITQLLLESARAQDEIRR